MFKCLALDNFEILAQCPLASVEKYPKQSIIEFRGLCVRKNSRADSTEGVEIHTHPPGHRSEG